MYIVVLDEADKVHSAILDLAALPAGANRDIVAHPWDQGTEIGQWMMSDLPRAARLTDAIQAKKFDDEVLDFLTSLASFWENLQPAAEEKDGLLFAMPGSADFVRTSPEVALDTWSKMRNLGK